MDNIAHLPLAYQCALDTLDNGERTAMRYFRVFWIDRDGIEHRSDPLTTWLDAMRYRAELIISGAVSAPCAARLVQY